MEISRRSSEVFHNDNLPQMRYELLNNSVYSSLSGSKESCNCNACFNMPWCCIEPSRNRLIKSLSHPASGINSGVDTDQTFPELPFPEPPFPELEHDLPSLSFNSYEPHSESNASICYGNAAYIHGSSSTIDCNVDIKVETPEGINVNVQIDRSWTARHLCTKLIQQGKRMEDKNWTLVEHLDLYSLERIIEDHERIADVVSQSKVRLKFCKDQRKYEVFYDPSQFLLLDMLKFNRSDLSQEEKKRQLLVDLRDHNSNLPDVQGYLHYRSSDQDKWRKYFFVLRKNGLYKRRTHKEEAKPMEFVSKLSDMNIYRCNNKKSINGYSNYGFCLKNSGREKMMLFCAESEKVRQCFITALRLFKYDEQITINFHEAKERDRTVTRKNNDSYSFSAALNERARVPMEFDTEGCGRVVDTPEEYEAIKLFEKFHYRDKLKQKAPWGLPLQMPVKESGTLLSSDSLPTYGLGSGAHMAQPWFHSNVNRAEAEELIFNSGDVDGKFLVRESQSLQGAFVVSVLYNGVINHLRIHTIEENDKLFLSLDRDAKFVDLIQLIDFYNNNRLNNTNLPIQLKYYVDHIKRKGSQ